MSEAGSHAFVTGGSSGIGRALTVMLVNQGAKVYIADSNIDAANALAAELNTTEQVVWTAEVDVVDWTQQVSAFEAAVSQFGRIDLVFPVAGIAERRAFPNRGPHSEGFEKPDLAVIDVNLTAVLYTISLALQQFRRQEKNQRGFRGKIGCVSSLCGLHAGTTLPIYSAAKHGIVGLVRGFGKYLATENITLNAVCPHVVRTGMSPGHFYARIEEEGLAVPMDGVLEAFMAMLGDSGISGECIEVGPSGFANKKAPEYWTDEGRRSVELISKNGEKWHQLVEG